MECYRAREAISALIDGEDPAVPDDALQAHLSACQDCRAWQQRAHDVTRRARLGGSFLDHDLSSAVLAAVPSGRPLARRAGLVAVAVAQLAITVPLLVVPAVLAAAVATLAGWLLAGAPAGHAFSVSLAVLIIACTVKPSAAAAVAGLRGLGLRPILLTGDNEATARAVAEQVGIDHVIAGTLPADKAAVITGLRAEGHQVAMVGDLRTVPDAIRLSRAKFRTIRRNLGWAFGYNAAALPLAALGFLNPIFASAAMTLSSVFVVANSLRLQRYH